MSQRGGGFLKQYRSVDGVVFIKGREGFDNLGVNPESMIIPLI